MTSKEIRQSFLDFFKSKDHRIVPSFPVIPHGDPTLLFINAGMNQFKDVFIGTGNRDYKRAADTQKCIRVSGKHNDLEEVGVDTYHHTFFEMLGNWSFGDYYKVEAIDWAWELLTKIWKLDPKRLYATVYRTDDEAYEIWKNYLPEDHIQRFDEKDNFWEMGNTGPCGPCSEVHYDRTPDMSGASLVNAGSPDVIEIWNLVFIQFNRKENGELEPLKDKFVDTGMGFERICSILQNVKSNYDTDIFTPILRKIQTLSGIEYTADLTKKSDIAMRVIADHLRALSFAIADGAMPGNEGRSYVLRRILRRACRYARELGFREPMMYKLVQTLVDVMGDYFKEIKQNQANIEKIIRGEEENFLQTMERGLDRIEEILTKIHNSNTKTISGDDAFLLYDTFGFPFDLTELIARERGLGVDIAGFEQKMKEQKERSKAAQKNVAMNIEFPQTDFVSEFIGYEELKAQSKILFIKDNLIVLEKTPFYAESGGQVSDIGEIIIAGVTCNIVNVKKVGNAIFHICAENMEEKINSMMCDILNKFAVATVDIQHRRAIMRNHTATHLLHETLYEVLGSHIQQAGSLVAADYLRFDFNHFEKVTSDQIRKIEDIVNSKILEQIPVDTKTCTIEEAQKNPKIKMFFGDKYGDIVRVLSMSNFSIELCGGTHVKNTAEIGLFKITSESAVAAGVRRIEAVTGCKAVAFVKSLEDKIYEQKFIIEELQDKIRGFEKEIEKAKLEKIAQSAGDISDNDKKMVGNLSVIVRKMENIDNLDQLRTIAEKTRESLNTQGICLIATIIDDKVQLACAVTDDLKGKMPAGKLVGEAAKLLGGGGGGKPHLATAGGKDISKLPQLLETEFYNIVEKF